MYGNEFYIDNFIKEYEFSEPWEFIQDRSSGEELEAFGRKCIANQIEFATQFEDE